MSSHGIVQPTCFQILQRERVLVVQGPFMMLDMGTESGEIRVMGEPRPTPQSKPGFSDDYGVLSPLHPEDDSPTDQVGGIPYVDCILGSQLCAGAAASTSTPLRLLTMRACIC